MMEELARQEYLRRYGGCLDNARLDYLYDEINEKIRQGKSIDWERIKDGITTVYRHAEGAGTRADIANYPAELSSKLHTDHEEHGKI